MPKEAAAADQAEAAAAVKKVAQKTVAGQIGDFPDLLRTINKGRSQVELTDALLKVVAAVQKTGKPGFVRYTVHVEPAGCNAGAQMTVTDEIGSKVPTETRYQSLYWATDDGRLVRSDPNQGELFEG